MTTRFDRSATSLLLALGLMGLGATGCGSDSKDDAKPSDTTDAGAKDDDASDVQGAGLVALKKETVDVQCECYGDQKQACLDGLWPKGSAGCLGDVYANAAKDPKGFECAEKVAETAVDCLKAADCDEDAQGKCIDTYLSGLFECIDIDTESAALECMGGTVEE